MSEGRKKGMEKEEKSGRLVVGGAMVSRSADGADMLIDMVFAARAFSGGELEDEADGGAVVLADELAISRPRKSLCAFRRNLFRAG